MNNKQAYEYIVNTTCDVKSTLLRRYYEEKLAMFEPVDQPDVVTTNTITKLKKLGFTTFVVLSKDDFHLEPNYTILGYNPESNLVALNSLDGRFIINEPRITLVDGIKTDTPLENIRRVFIEQLTRGDGDIFIKSNIMTDYDLFTISPNIHRCEIKIIDNEKLVTYVVHTNPNNDETKVVTNMVFDATTGDVKSIKRLWYIDGKLDSEEEMLTPLHYPASRLMRVLQVLKQKHEHFVKRDVTHLISP